MNESSLHAASALDASIDKNDHFDIDDSVHVEAAKGSLSATASLRSPFAALAPVPVTLAQTGLSVNLLRDLLLKHLFAESVASIRRLAARMHLVGAVIEELTALLREDALLELSRELHGDGTLAFRLSERGRW